MLAQKIDFAVVLKVKKANPNGDPLLSNMPRTDYGGYGEISDVCLKRKIRNRLLDSGQKIFVQSNDYKEKNDTATSLKARAEELLGKNFISKMSEDEIKDKACKAWLDVRAFGQLFAMKGDDKGKKKVKKDGDGTDGSDGGDGVGASGLSAAIRGPVSIQAAFSVQPVEVTSTQITKSVNSEDSKDGNKKSSDTMGMKHRVEEGVYVFYGSMNPQLAEKTGFSEADALAIKSVLPRIFENDASSARPEGSMEVLKVIWWQHNSKQGQYSSAKVHRSLKVHADGSIELSALSGLEPEIIEGF